MEKTDLSKARNCAHRRCVGIGKWLPVLVIRLVGQDEQEKPVTVGIPMFLCDYHKMGFNPGEVLTSMGKMRLMIKVAALRRKRLNWDTLSVEWRTDQDAARIITNPGGTIQ